MADIKKGKELGRQEINLRKLELSKKFNETPEFEQIGENEAFHELMSS